MTARPLHERLVFDTARGAVLDDKRRYVLVRADVLAGLFAQLDGAARERALEACARSVAAHGADSVRAYSVAVGRDALVPMMEGAAASLGWGRWRFDAERIDDEPVPRLDLVVADSPFAAPALRGTQPVCHAIAGMLAALGDALWSCPVEARETHCAATGGDATCSFVVAPRATAGTDRPEPPPARRPSPPGEPS